MKTSPTLVIPSAGVRAVLFLVAALFAISGTAHAQTIYVADPNGTNGVSSYNIDGTLINSSLIPGTTYEGLALSGSTLYVANPGYPAVGTATLNGTGGVSSTGSFFVGAPVNGVTNPYGLAVTSTNLYVANLNTGNVFKIDLNSHLEVNALYTTNNNGGAISNPYGLAISGDTLFVSQATTGIGMNTIKGYSLTTFSTTPTLTITSDLNLPHGLAVSGTTLYVANGGDGTIATFDTTSGAVINPALITGLTGPQGITFYGSALYVSGSDGTVKGFDATSGAALAGFTTISGLSSPNGIVISAATAVPEPSTFAAIAGAAMLGIALLRRRRALA